MGLFAHAQTVDTRPLFPPTTWPGYEATSHRAADQETSHCAADPPVMETSPRVNIA